MRFGDSELHLDPENQLNLDPENHLNLDNENQLHQLDPDHQLHLEDSNGSDRLLVDQGAFVGPAISHSLNFKYEHIIYIFIWPRCMSYCLYQWLLLSPASLLAARNDRQKVIIVWKRANLLIRERNQFLICSPERPFFNSCLIEHFKWYLSIFFINRLVKKD